MSKRKLFAVITLVALVGIAATSMARPDRRDSETRFTIRIENISSKDGQIASNGTRWPFALSPGLWVAHDKDVMLFKDSKPASKSIEMQAEDGDPTGLARMLDTMNHTRHGVFNTPVGASSPGPIRPGNSYEFTITARPEMKLTITMMFGQSNDWFYAANGIELFGKGGKPLSGEITSRFIVYDAGTEKDEELGIGPNQGPRQKATNTGEDEHGVVHKAKDSPFFPKNAELFRVTVTPEIQI